MGNGHTAVNEFLREKKRFADFFNGNVFRGEQIVLPEELEEIKGETDILIEDKEKKEKKVQRYRDIVMRWKKGTYLAILACENQSHIHYAMPVRRMLYDSLSYSEQTRQVWEQHHQKEHKNLSGEEYVSRFSKEDKLVPVITIVFYYGTKEWDGSVDLYGLFPKEVSMSDEILHKYVPNYWINLIDAGNVDDVECFRTDLKEIFEMTRIRKDRQELVSYIKQHNDYFRDKTRVEVHAISELLQSKELMSKLITQEETEGEMNMCKALEDFYQEGVEEGKVAGKAEGIIKATLKFCISETEIVELLMEELQIEEAKAKEYLEENKTKNPS